MNAINNKQVQNFNLVYKIRVEQLINNIIPIKY